MIPSATFAEARGDAVERLALHDPVCLADLLTLVALRGRATRLVLRPEGDSEYRLDCIHERRHLVTLLVDVGVANATAARFASLARIDLRQVASGAKGQVHLGRFRAAVDSAIGAEGELLVSLATTPLGLSLEVRPLAANGQPLAESARGQLRRCPACQEFASWHSERCTRDGTPLVEISDRVEAGGSIGSYTLGAILGHGASGTIFAAEHALIGSPAAVKVNRESFAQSPARCYLFLREARASSRIRHPSVVSVVDYGLLADGRPYLVMERIVGESLAARLDRCGALPVGMALRCAREIAGALVAAHASGVVHLDVKPSNVILLAGSGDLAPHVKLIDFGSALDAGDATTDETARVCGTPEYMSPERALGLPAQACCDIYALGVVLYEMLSGAVPFRDPSMRKILLAQIVTPAPRVRSPFGEVAPPIAALVARALSKKVDERQQGMIELIAELDAALASCVPPA